MKGVSFVLCYVIYDGEKIEFELTKKRIKNINLRVKSDGSVHVSAPMHVSQSRVDAFVIDQVPFIWRARLGWKKRNAQKKPPLQYVTGEELTVLGHPVCLVVEALKGRKTPYVTFNGQDTLYLYAPINADRAAKEKAMVKYWKTLGSRVFPHWAKQVYDWFCEKGYQVPYPEIKQRAMTTRWGTCAPGRGIITMNLKLLEGPEVYIEYVMVHEFAHFIHANHSAAFHAVVAQFLPDWKARKQALNEYFRSR